MSDVFAAHPVPWHHDKDRDGYVWDSAGEIVLSAGGGTTPRAIIAALGDMSAALPDLLALVKEYRTVCEYYIRVSENAGDAEGANLKRFTLARIDAALEKAEGRSNG